MTHRLSGRWSRSSARPGWSARRCSRCCSEREFPAREIRALASARSADSELDVDGRSFAVAEATPEAFDGVDIALFSAGADSRPRAGARGGRAWRGGDRQLVRLAHGRRRAARRQPGQRRRSRVAQGHRGQPELLDDAARAAARRAARRGRPAPGDRRHLPVRVGHRLDRDRGAGGPDPRARGGRADRGVGLPASRSPSTRCPRSTPSWTTATPRRSGRSSPSRARSCTCPTCRSRARPCACRSSTATRRRSTSRRSGRSTRRGTRALSRRSPASRSSTTRPRTAIRWPPWTRPGSDVIFVGRVRADVSLPEGRGLAFWVVSDNLRKGAATNAVELAELCPGARTGRARRRSSAYGRLISRAPHRQGATERRHDGQSVIGSLYLRPRLSAPS